MSSHMLGTALVHVLTCSTYMVDVEMLYMSLSVLLGVSPLSLGLTFGSQ